MQRSEGGGGISNFLNSCCKFTEHRPMTPPPIPRANIIIPRIPCPIETLLDQRVMHIYIKHMEDLAVRVYRIYVLYIMRESRVESDYNLHSKITIKRSRTPFPQYECKYTSYPSNIPPSEKLESNMHLTDN